MADDLIERLARYRADLDTAVLADLTGRRPGQPNLDVGSSGGTFGPTTASGDGFRPGPEWKDTVAFDVDAADGIDGVRLLDLSAAGEPVRSPRRRGFVRLVVVAACAAAIVATTGVLITDDTTTPTISSSPTSTITSATTITSPTETLVVPMLRGVDDLVYTTVPDVPPLAQAVPSSPESGELVAAVSTIHEGAWFLYADGRLISIDNTRLQSGWVEQRLTAAGVERVRSEFLASGLFDLNQQPTELPPDKEWSSGYPRVRDGGRLLVGRHGTETSAEDSPGSDPGRSPCETQGGAKCQLITYLRGLASSLPQNEWVVQDFTPYVPARYLACLAVLPESTSSGLDPLADLRARLALMPSAVSELLGGREPTPAGSVCFDLTLADTRVVFVAALTDARTFDAGLNARQHSWALDLHGWVGRASTAIDAWALLPGGGRAIWAG